MSIGMVAIIMVFAVPLVAIVGGLMIEALKVLKGGSSRRSKTSNAEEAKMMQALYQSLARMEERIEALETLLLEREREDRNR